MLENKKVIIFDMDGTLIDSVGIWNEVDKQLINKISRVDILQEDLDNIQMIRDKKLREYSTFDEPYIEYCNYLKSKYNSELSAVEIHDLRYKIADLFLVTRNRL